MTRALIASAFVLACGCSSYTQTIPALQQIPASASLPAEGDLTVGTARVDVTPAPGPSTFGHGPDAHATSGYWSRLYCRVFILKTDQGPPLALVPCDLAAISVVLHRRVGEFLNQQRGNQAIIPSADRVMISATHTHHGPAHYFEGPAYGGITSTRLPGYDEAMRDWLAARIADGIVRASKSLRPARARWVHTELWGLTRNRSLYAHRMNGPSPNAGHEGKALTDSQKAIDPALHVLQLQELSQDRTRTVAPLGWLALFSMHPTVMPAPTRMFHADAFGVASRGVERRLNQLRAAAGVAGEALAGIINANEGDISPSWIEGTTDETIRLGEQLASELWKTHASADPIWRTRLRVDSRYLEHELPGAKLSDGTSLCEKAMLGASSIHGATDHPCTLDRLLAEEPDYDPKARDGDEHKRCHAPKRQMMGGMQTVLITEEGFPTHVPLALVRIDDTFLAHVPAEMTVAAGRLVTNAVKAQIPTLEDHRASHAVVAGLTNGYIQYVTTQQEYQVQTYEGGSTLYGPNTARYLAERFTWLASSMRFDLPEPQRPKLTGTALPGFHVHYAASRKRLARPGDDPALDDVPRRGEGTTVCALLRDPPTLCMKWRDGGPGRVMMPNVAAWIRLVNERDETIRLETPAENGFGTAEPSGFIDDRGLGFQTHARDRNRGAWEWTTVWRPTRQEWMAIMGTRRVKLAAGELSSVPFGAEILDSPCDADIAAECIAD